MPVHMYNIKHGQKLGGDRVSPKTGRPYKGDAKKNVRIEIRITEEKSEQLKRCAKTLKISRAEVIEHGIDLVEAEIEK